MRKKFGVMVFCDVLEIFEVDNFLEEFEVFGEKVFLEGYVDIFIKLKYFFVFNRYIFVEVKIGKV